MSAWLKSLFATIFGTNSEIATFIISMIPIVELRGAIPFGSASSFWGEHALPLWESFLIAVAGSTLICIILTFAFQPLFSWLKRTKAFKKLATWVENKLKRKSKNIDEKTEKATNSKRALWLKLVGVFCFVAVPLPLTGVWTGTCLALFIGLNRKQTMGAVILGNAVAGGLMTLISYFFADNTSIVLYAFLILVAVFILFELIKSLVLKLKNKKSVKGKEVENFAQAKTANNNSLSIEAKAETFIDLNGIESNQIKEDSTK